MNRARGSAGTRVPSQGSTHKGEGTVAVGRSVDRSARVACGITRYARAGRAASSVPAASVAKGGGSILCGLQDGPAVFYLAPQRGAVPPACAAAAPRGAGKSWLSDCSSSAFRPSEGPDTWRGRLVTQFAMLLGAVTGLSLVPGAVRALHWPMTLCSRQITS